MKLFFYTSNARRIRVILFFLGVLVMNEARAQTNALQPTGTGTSADPYQIASLENLSWLSQNPSVWHQHFEQVADIDAAETQFWDDMDDNTDGDLHNDPNDTTVAGNNEGFFPIGDNFNGFTGVFNGKGYTITNLTINRPTQNTIGFFGLVLGAADIIDVHITNADIIGNFEVGTLIGFNSGNQVIDCHGTGMVNGARNVGGLIGYSILSSLARCFANTVVNGTDGFSGGLIGHKDNGLLEDCYALGSVNDTNGLSGGLIGFLWYDPVQNSFSTGAVSGPFSEGLVGSCFCPIQNSFWDTETSGQATSNGATGKTTAEMQQQSTFTDAGWDFSTVWKLDGINNNGYPYLQWQKFDPAVSTLAVSNISQSTVMLNATIDNLGNPSATSHGFEISLLPDFDFRAAFVADTPINTGNYVKELTDLSPGTEYYVRAFVTNSDGIVYSNVETFTTHIVPTSFTQPSGMGTQADPYLISNLQELLWISQSPGAWDKHFEQTADIDAADTQFLDDSDDNNDGDPYNDPNDATGEGNNEGFSPIGISDPYFTGSYTGNGHTISDLQINRPSQNGIGFFGLVLGAADIVDVHIINADITGNSHVGTLIGLLSSQVRDCHGTGTVNAAAAAGGLIGGSLFGTVTNCFANSTVNAVNFPGGLIGMDTGVTIGDSYAMGSVNGSTAGGLIGSSEATAVSNCFANGAVSGASAGGLMGSSLDLPQNGSFWDIETSGLATSEGGTGKTTAEMQLQSTFTDAGWDFSTVWHIDGVNNNGYPYLQWQEFDPMVITEDVSSIAATSVTVNGTLINLGFPEVVEHGFQLAPTANFESAGTIVLGTPEATGVFTAGYSLLQQNTTYFVRTLVRDASNTITYGQTVSFTTLVDDQSPTPSLQNLPAVVNGPFTLELVFDEEVQELIPNPVEVAPADDTRGTATLDAVIAAPDAVYTIVVTPTIAGELIFFNEFAGMAKDLAGNLSNPLPQTSVIYDPVTLSPVINAPLDNTTTNGMLTLDFHLPETAELGSAMLVFAETGNPGATVSLTFDSSVGAAGDHQVTLDLTDLLSAPEVVATIGGNSLQEGTSYDLTLSYSDVIGNPAASAMVQNFVFDAQAPLLPFVGIGSNNSVNTARATIGDEVTLTFESNVPLSGAIGNINTTVVLFTNLSGNRWQGTLVINENSPEGEVPFELFATGINELGTFVTSTTDGSNVIVDTTAPTPNCQNLTVQLDATGSVSISPEEVDNGSFDENGILDRSLNTTSFGCAHLGENMGILILTDTAGNGASCEVLITVVDAIAPTVRTRDINLILDDMGTAQLGPQSVDNGSFDNCIVADIQLDQTDFTLADLGENQVLLTVIDSSGNSATGTAMVTLSVLDEDNDGVPDFEDACPSTPSGVAVDDQGCEIPVVFNKLSFHPNPTVGMVRILVPGSESELMVQVTTSLGNMVFSRVFQVPDNRELQLHLEHLASGTYTVYLSGNEFEEGFRIIKQ